MAGLNIVLIAAEMSDAKAWTASHLTDYNVLCVVTPRSRKSARSFTADEIHATARAIESGCVEDLRSEVMPCLYGRMARST